MNSAFVEGSPVDVLLFGQKQRMTYSSSLGFTASSESSSGGALVVASLKHIIKVCNITTFNISTFAPDGSRLYTVENAANHGGMSKIPQDSQMQTKIQVLLDQRKPRTEDLPSLCSMYDQDLNAIESD